MAITTQRTLRLTKAPIFSSLRRIVPQLARAKDRPEMAGES